MYSVWLTKRHFTPCRQHCQCSMRIGSKQFQHPDGNAEIHRPPRLSPTAFLLMITAPSFFSWPPPKYRLPILIVGREERKKAKTGNCPTPASLRFGCQPVRNGCTPTPASVCRGPPVNSDLRSSQPSTYLRRRKNRCTVVASTVTTNSPPTI